MAFRIGRSPDGKSNGFKEDFLEDVPFAEKAGPKEIDGLRPRSCTGNMEIFLKRIFENGDENSFKDFVDSWIGDLDSNTGGSPSDTRHGGNYENYSKEELDKIWSDDPQYVNEKVYRPLPGTRLDLSSACDYSPEEILEMTKEAGHVLIKDDRGNITDKNLEYSKEELIELIESVDDIVEDTSLYLTDGLHGDHTYTIDANGVEKNFYDKGVINWHHDAVLGTESLITIEKGRILKRYGSDEGRYLADDSAKLENLNLPSDGIPLNRYLVVKTFSALKSEIADQPFTLRSSDSQRETQFKTDMSISDLIKQGYLKKIKGEMKVRIGHFNEGASPEARRESEHKDKNEGEKRPSIADFFRNDANREKTRPGDGLKNEGGKRPTIADFFRNDANREKTRPGEGLKNEGEKRRTIVDFFRKDANREKSSQQGREESNSLEKVKSAREDFLERIRTEKSASGENRENKKEKNNKPDGASDENPSDNVSEIKNTRTNDFRESLKVQVDPYEHLKKPNSPRPSGGFERLPGNNKVRDDMER